MLKSNVYLFFGIFSLFLPLPLGVVLLLMAVLYSVYKKQLIVNIKNQQGFIWLYSFIGLISVVSIIYSNWIGLLNALAMLVISLWIANYRSLIDSNLFIKLVDLILVLACVWGVGACLEFNFYSIASGHSFFDFYVQNSPKMRIHSVFFNANIYATMLAFFCLLCVYRFVHVDPIKKLIYVFIGLFQLGLLFLTGCRAAMLGLVISVPLFFLFAKEKVWLKICLGFIGLSMLILVFDPELVPRIDDLKTINSRFLIWNAALIGISMYPLFGMGPQTYQILYQMLDAKKAPHCHNIFFDSLLSYGIVGTILLVGYIVSMVKEVCLLRFYHLKEFGLIVSFGSLCLVMGLMDCTLNYLATGLLFMMVVNLGVLSDRRK